MKRAFSTPLLSPEKLRHKLGHLSRAQVVKLVDAGD